MTHARYTPQMVVATVCVLLVPAAIVALLHAHGRVTSFWVCALLALVELADVVQERGGADALSLTPLETHAPR